MPVKRKITRKKSAEGKVVVNYFDQKTHDAIVQYQQEPNEANKRKIYSEKILPVFDTLIENLIHVYGFQVMYDSKNDLKNECSSHLYLMVNKFDPTKGSKAFSYFNVVAKHFLTIKSKNNVKKLHSNVSLDNKDLMTQNELQMLEDYDYHSSAEEKIVSLELFFELRGIVRDILKQNLTEKEKICLDAIIGLLEKSDEVELLNKKAVMLYLRDLTNLDAKDMAAAISGLKKYYKEIKAAKYNKD